jgi:hypothetical protein
MTLESPTRMTVPITTFDEDSFLREADQYLIEFSDTETLVRLGRIEHYRSLIESSLRHCPQSYPYNLRVVVGGGAIRDLLFHRDFVDLDIYLIPDYGSFPVHDGDSSFPSPYGKASPLSDDSKRRYVETVTEFFKQTDERLELFLETSRQKSEGEDPEPYYCTNRIKDTPGVQDEAFRTLFSDCEVTAKIVDLILPNFSIQVLWRNSATCPQTLIDKFDLDICQFAYDGKDFFIGTHVDMTSVGKALLKKGPVRLMFPTTSYRRLKKFRDRFGCSITEALRSYIQAKERQAPEFGFLGSAIGKVTPEFYGPDKDSLPELLQKLEREENPLEEFTIDCP